MRSKPIIKVLGRGVLHAKDFNILSRQLPKQRPADWPDFVYDPEARIYDWLAVYDNLPPLDGERNSMRVERLACPPENTILVTSEPSSIKRYDRAFINQFGRVITSHEPAALDHPGRVFGVPGLRWFYGMGGGHARTYDEIVANPPRNKSDEVGMMSSTKQDKHTAHLDRYRFTMALARLMPEANVFGRGLRGIADKADAIDPYKYQIVIENHIADAHVSEKLTDAFLGLALPFYFGAPDIAKYFPADSVIPIDIRNPEHAVAIIRSAMAAGEYEKRLPAIEEARRRVLDEYNVMTMLVRETQRGIITPPPRPSGVLMSQRAARRAHPLQSAGDFGQWFLRRVVDIHQRSAERRRASSTVE